MPSESFGLSLEIIWTSETFTSQALESAFTIVASAKCPSPSESCRMSPTQALHTRTAWLLSFSSRVIDPVVIRGQKNRLSGDFMP